jgi:hypothetical protein
VDLLVFADESGTYDFAGKQPGAGVVGIGGYAGFPDDWAVFCDDWQRVLDNYQDSDAPKLYFHFCEWAMASAIVRGRRESNSTYTHGPYARWNLDKLDSFKVELAAIAGGGRKRFPFAQLFDLKRYHTEDVQNELARVREKTGEPDHGFKLVYAVCFHEFFSLFLEDLGIRYPTFNGSIGFVLEDREDDDWKAAAFGIFQKFAEADARLGGIRFENKHSHLPLQAADMIAYRLHQMGSTRSKTGQWPELKPMDLALLGYSSPEEAAAHFQRLLGDIGGGSS